MRISAIALLACISLSAQDSAGLQARQLYYKSKGALETDETPKTKPESKPAQPRPKPHSPAADRPQKDKPAAGPAPLGLKYTVEQEDAAGKYVQVDTDSTFATGDAIRLRMEVNSDAYVYLLSRGASGDGNFLFPEPGEDNRLKPFQSIQVPAAGDPIRFAEPAGTETLYILVSRSPVADLDRLLPARGSSPGAQPSNASMMAANVPSAQMGEMFEHAQHMESRDLVRGKVRPVSTGGSAAVNEHAVYAVNVSTTPGAQVLQKLDLKHR